MNETKIIVPQLSVLEIQLIINNQLFVDGIISEAQYREVYKIIYEKIEQLKKSN